MVCWCAHSSSAAVWGVLRCGVVLCWARLAYAPWAFDRKQQLLCWCGCEDSSVLWWCVCCSVASCCAGRGLHVHFEPDCKQQLLCWAGGVLLTGRVLLMHLGHLIAAVFAGVV